MRTKAKPEKKVKPLAVLEFHCDGCRAKINCVLIVEQGVIPRIAKSFCEGCWSTNTLNPLTKLEVH